MSAIANFTLLPKSSIDGLRDAAVPKKNLFGKPKYVFHEYLSQHGRALTEYNWSGYVIATLLPYLEQKRSIELMKSEFDELGSFLTNSLGSTTFILTHKHKEAYSVQLEPETYSEGEMREYFEDFNATKFEEAGKAMLDGIKVIQSNLAQANSDNIILLSIG